jgi:(p)ppGpp synthase/HD superfamily hydrolase
MTTKATLREAKYFAAGAHAGKTYGHGERYGYHLNDVEHVLLRYGFDDDTELRIAAWLHDSIEDTAVNTKLVQDYFGDDVYKLVEAVTDKPGKNRAARHEATYTALRTVGTRAVALKLADRIANVEYSIAMGDIDKLKMYRHEHLFFKNTLAKPFEHIAMWEHLNRLLRDQ